MRGKEICILAIVVKIGITPAYAGKSVVFKTLHPHLLGSPPRMRGKGVLDFYSIGFGGITPAYAGKRLRLST